MSKFVDIDLRVLGGQVSPYIGLVNIGNLLMHYVAESKRPVYSGEQR